DQTKASQAVWAFVDSLLPPHAETAQSPIHSILDDIVKARGSVGLIGLVAFIWFTTGLFGTLRSVLAEVFDIQDTRGVVGGKIFDIKITVVATVLFVAYTMLNAYVGIATSRGVQVIAGLGVRAEVIGRAEYFLAKAIALLAILSMFFALYKYLPSRRIRWQAAMLGAIFTATFFEIARNLFTAYLRSFDPGSLYTGTLYTIVILVLWVYYSAFFFIIGGELGQVYELRRVRRHQRETFEE
ncbi:MAG: YihY/virulence factor BrkB family protein, partial [Gemmatimonadota bacterium]|nr:YihY/virulence factor BrkB family protein [Gemmatimonadota bacterium]